LDESLKENNLFVAGRCCAALSDVARLHMIHKIQKHMIQLANEEGRGAKPKDMVSHWSIRARISIVLGDLRSAEQLFVDHGHVDMALEMYSSMRRWTDTIRVAELIGHPETETLKNDYFQHLCQSGQVCSLVMSCRVCDCESDVVMWNRNVSLVRSRRRRVISRQAYNSISVVAVQPKQLMPSFAHGRSLSLKMW